MERNANEIPLTCLRLEKEIRLLALLRIVPETEAIGHGIFWRVQLEGDHQIRGGRHVADVVDEQKQLAAGDFLALELARHDGAPETSAARRRERQFLQRTFDAVAWIVPQRNVRPCLLIPFHDREADARRESRRM